MPLPRLQLFEINDHPRAPTWLRDSLIWSLSRTLDWSHALDALVPPFEAFLDAAGTRQVLELASGAGGPASLLAQALARRGAAPTRFTLSDLTPHVDWWETLARETPGLDFVAEPVDATALGPELAKDKACIVVNALHHFPPQLAEAVICSAAQQSRGVFIAEGLIRNPLRFAALAPAGLGALALSPLLMRGHRLKRALLTWGTPLVVASAIWDGTVSSLRMHDEADLRRYVEPLGDAWRWTWGEFEYGGFGRGSYFWGTRR